MDDLSVRLDWTQGDPVYEQIAGQIRSRIASGDLPPGFPLPPVRTLASDLGVNLNTVARAYRLLEGEGFVRIRDRLGVEVAAPPESASRESWERLREELRSVLERTKQAGMRPDEIRQAVEAELAALGQAAGRKEETR